MLNATNFISPKSLRKINCMKQKTETLTTFFFFSTDFFLPSSFKHLLVTDPAVLENSQES